MKRLPFLALCNRRPLWFLCALMLPQNELKSESIYCIISLMFTSSLAKRALQQCVQLASACQLTTRCSYFTSLYVILNIQAALFPHHFLPFNGRLDDANQMKSTFLSLLLPSSLYRARSLASALLAAPLGRLNYKEKYFRATILFPIKFGELSPRIKMGHDPRSAQRSREGKKKVHQTFNSRCWWLRS